MKLPDGLLEIVDDRGTGETLDLDRDLQRALLRGEQPLGAEVDVQITYTPAQAQGVVRDRPPVVDERPAHMVVVQIASGHVAPNLAGARCPSKAAMVVPERGIEDVALGFGAELKSAAWRC
jgi:hypothetical protein